MRLRLIFVGRTATDPVSRISPQVYRGEVVSECIDIAGRPSCKVADGSWKPCAASGAAAPQAGPAPVPEPVPEPAPEPVPEPVPEPAPSSESAVTVDGEACILPSVSDGEDLRPWGGRDND